MPTLKAEVRSARKGPERRIRCTEERGRPWVLVTMGSQGERSTHGWIEEGGWCVRWGRAVEISVEVWWLVL